MIEVCSNKEVEKTWQSGVDRRLQPEAGNFLSHPVQERNITNSEWAKQFGLLSFFFRKPGLLGPLHSFSLVLWLYTATFPSFFFFFFAKKRTFYFILKSALFHKTGRFSKKIQTWSFQLEISNKEKDKKQLAGTRRYFPFWFLPDKQKKIMIHSFTGYVKKTDCSLFVLSCSWYPCSHEK